MTYIVSYSEVVKHQTCQRQHYYRFILNRKPVEEYVPMQIGIKGHKLLQDFYNLMREGHSKEEALARTQQVAKKIIQEKQVTDFSILIAWTSVDNYIRATNFTAEAILVENRFLLPASKLISHVDGLDLDQVHIGFTPDVVFQRSGGFIDIEDAKFVGRAWSQREKDRFSQLKLYQVFMEAMGYDISRCLIRFFNVKTGKTDTQPYVMETEEKPILIRDFMQGVKAVVESRSKSPEEQTLAPRTMNYGACKSCPFVFPCNLEAKGKSAANTLKNMYTGGDYDYRS